VSTAPHFARGDFEKESRVIFVLRCSHCGQELNRSLPVTREEALSVKCFLRILRPCGCTSNAPTQIDEFPA
jgi:hypothetical protein